MATTMLQTSQPRLSFQGMSPMNVHSTEIDGVFVLTDLKRAGPTSTSSGSSGQKTKNGEGGNQKKGKTLPNVMEKSLFKLMKVRTRSKDAWGSDDGHERTTPRVFPDFRHDGVTSGLPPSTRSRVTPGDSGHYRLPLLNHNRQFLLSRDSTRPKSRKDGLQGMGDEVDQHKTLLNKRVEEAVETAKKIRDRVREDKAMGMPSILGPSKANDIKFIDENRSIAKALRKSKKARGTENDNRDKTEVERKYHRQNRVGDKIPGNFKFPKESDFIPVATDKTRIKPIHVDWFVCGNVNIDRENHSTIPGKLLKSSANPLTDALHKEGTSVTKKQGKVLGQGDFPVAKVWARPSHDITMTVLPSQMAREDINLASKSRQTTNKNPPQSNHSSAPKSEGAERASDIDVFSMSDRLTEILEVPEEEEE